MEIPGHLKNTISVGEDVLSIFTGDYSRKGKKGISINNGLLIITTEKLIIEGKKDIEKIFLSNILNVDLSKNKIKMNNFLRDGSEEEKIEIIIKRNKDEAKNDFSERCVKIQSHLERYLDEAASTVAEDDQNSLVAKLSAKIEQKVIIPKPIASEKVFCWNCGEMLPPGGSFCAKCGTKIK
ncbi:MAG: zinc ribbon domain-containing protein [Candidatus Lokiarchaeota archaeon]|nr:zinc ribbon domain-containing protein [Candidatus Lokiarchaeota archaeon]